MPKLFQFENQIHFLENVHQVTLEEDYLVVAMKYSGDKLVMYKDGGDYDRFLSFIDSDLTVINGDK